MFIVPHMRHLSSKKRTRTGASSAAPIRVNESISQNVLEWSRSLFGFSYLEASAYPHLRTLREN